MTKNKAQSMPLNIIVVAVIVLIVLVVLIVIFSGKIQLFGKGVTEQSSQYESKNCAIPGTNRQCYTLRDDCISDGGYIIIGRYEDCEKQNAECCQL